MNMLLQRGNEVGMYDASRSRGRGVWMDDGRMVIHAGDRLIIDGKSRELFIDSQYVYEQSQRIIGKIGKMLDNDGAAKYLALCKRLNWEAPVMAYLCAGWVAIAPLCGILPWRPHMWLLGPARAGKSTITKLIVSRMLGKFHVYAQGSVTEPAIRAMLKQDALPCVLDEMEGNSRAARTAVSAKLELVRSMSDGDGPSIYKGVSGGGGFVEYKLNSMAFMASIGFGAEQSADVSRITQIAVKANTSGGDGWKTLHNDLLSLLTPDFVAAFQARTIALAPVILQNSVIFKEAVIDVLKDQRVGDQLGPILAGAWSLGRSSVVTLEQAREWVAKHEWATEKETAGRSDELLLLDTILEQFVRFEVNGGWHNKTVAQLASAVAYPVGGKSPITEEYNLTLQQRGMVVRDGFFNIGCESEWLKEVMEGKGWAVSGIRGMLGRIAGAENVGQSTMASKRVRSVVRIPLAACGIVPEEGAQLELNSDADWTPF